MSLTTHERFVSYPAVFNGGGFTLNHVRNVSAPPGIEKMLGYAGGAVDPQVIAEAFRDPKVNITSGDIGTILAAVSPVSGLNCTGSSIIQFQQRSSGGTFAGAGNHGLLTAPLGFLYIEEISAQQDAKEGATVRLVFVPLRSGSNMPLVPSAGQSLTGSVAINGLYRLSKVVYEGSVIGGVQSVRFRSGITAPGKRESGNVAADVCSIVRREPMFEVKGTNFSKIASVGLGVAAISAGLTCYFEKYGVANGNHASITFAGGTYHADGIDQSDENDAEFTIVASRAGGSVGFSAAGATIP